MSIRSMRLGDTIVSTRGEAFEVEEKDYDRVKARRVTAPHRLRTFHAERLECVDHDDGLWQEMEATHAAD